MADLTALLERITEAKGADRGIDREIDYQLWHPIQALHNPDGAPHFTSSIDAALGLVEKVLPGNRIIIDTRNPIRVKLYPEGLESHSDKNLTGYAATAPLAVLAALIRAKISEAG